MIQTTKIPIINEHPRVNLIHILTIGRASLAQLFKIKLD